MPKRKGEILLIKGIPFNTKHNFKAWAARRGKSMTEIIIDFMKSKANSEVQTGNK